MIDYYQSKTEAIERRYGIAHRVHYHTGLRTRIKSPYDSREHHIHTRQEELLHRVYAEFPEVACPRVLDAGCGLGGGSLFWSQVAHARVTALTNVPSQVEYVQRAASRLLQSDSIEVVNDDANTFERPRTYDVIVAVESACYFDRERWLRVAASSLRRNGRIVLVDVMTGEGHAPDRAFDSYWRTRNGVPSSYRAAASHAGLTAANEQDWSVEAAEFWPLMSEIVQAEKALLAPDDTTRHARLEKTLSEYQRLEDGLRSGALSYRCMTWEKQTRTQ